MSALLTRPPAALSRLPLRRRQAREWAASCALVLAGHALLLGGWDSWPPPPGLAMQEGALHDPPRQPPLLVVRTVRVDAAEATAPTPRERRADAVWPVDVDAPARPRAVADAAPVASAGGVAAGVTTGAAPASPPSPSPRAGTATGKATGTATDTATGTESATQAAAETASEIATESAAEAAGATTYAGAPPPVWTTRVPGDFALAYAVRRGEEAPRPATLRFESREGRYTLQLQLAAGGRGPEQASQGRLEPGGLAPERYVDRRRARAAAAANFDPTGARITYSGAAAVQPLFPGTQDRLSWLVQLAAVLEADPARAPPGARLPLYVSGARGDAQLWTFEVRSPTPQDGSGDTGARLVYLVREPQRPYDLRVEAWLDPAQQHLPARLRLTPVPAGAPLEWWRLP